MKRRSTPAYRRGLAGLCMLILAAGCRAPSGVPAPPSLSLSAAEQRQAQAYAHYTQALIYENLDKAISERALEHYARAAELDPGHHRLYAKVATGEFLRDKPERAVAILQESRERLPDSVLARHDLATAYGFTGALDRAAREFQGVLDMDPSHTVAYIGLSDIYFAQERDARAIELLDRGLRTAAAPERIRTHCYKRGLAFIESREAPRALPCFQLVVRHAKSRHAEIYHLMGQLFEGFECYDEARQCYAWATEAQSPLPQSYIRLALLTLDQGADEAIRIMNGGLDRNPEDVILLLALGQVYGTLKRYDDAIAVFDRIVVLAESREDVNLTPGFYLHFGSACERAGELDRAEALFETCIEKFPDSHQVLNYLAYMWAEQGVNLDKALSYVNRALEHDPDNGAYLDTRGWVYYMRGDYQEALVHIEAASTLIPRDPTIIDHLGDTWSALGDRTRALDHWRESFRLDTGNQTVAEKLQANGVDPSALDAAGDDNRDALTPPDTDLSTSESNR